MSQDNKRKLFTEWAMDMAENSKTRSTCLSRQVGAVIIKDNQILSTGYNGSPCGTIHCIDIGYCERKKRNIPSGKGLEICRAGHAETNAITQCAKNGTSCNGAILYVTTQPCVFCCINIIQSGIKKIVFKGSYPTGLGEQLLKESQIELIEYEKELEDERIIQKGKDKENNKSLLDFIKYKKDINY